MLNKSKINNENAYDKFSDVYLRYTYVSFSVKMTGKQGV